MVKLKRHKKIRVFEGFAGYGGATFGLQRAGINFDVVGYSEFDKFASALYDENHKVKAVIDMDKISSIFMMSVTIDNINAFAAKAEKLRFMQLKSNAISIAVDDLMVYREYFNSPLMFLHFLQQRSLATQESKLALMMN